MPRTTSSSSKKVHTLTFERVALGAVDSTNTEAKRLAEAGAPAGTVVTAKEQRAGRGRAGRKWQSPLGNLYASLILRPQRPASDAGSLSLLAALALGHTLGDIIMYVDSWQVKWPNDVLVNGAKIAGVLAESEFAADGKLSYVVVGMGLNVEVSPPVSDRPVTSLKALEAAATVDQVLDKLLANFRRLYELWEKDGFAAVKLDWISHAQGFGCPVFVRLANQPVTGNFADLDDDGALVIEESDGTRRRVLAGDVVLAH